MSSPEISPRALKGEEETGTEGEGEEETGKEGEGQVEKGKR